MNPTGSVLVFPLGVDKGQGVGLEGGLVNLVKPFATRLPPYYAITGHSMTALRDLPTETSLYIMSHAESLIH